MPFSRPATVPAFRSWPGLALLAILALVSCTLLAQEEIPTISVNVKVVNVLATVRDRNGNIIHDLGKEDFALEEDGRPQTIKYFTRETDQPLSLGLLVDTSGSQLRVLDEEKRASEVFANEVLRDQEDSAFLLQFAGEAELLQEITTSRSALVSSLRKVGPPEDRGGSSGGWGGIIFGGGRNRRGSGGGMAPGGTVLYDAIFLAADEVMQPQQGRKAIIVLTDGVDHGSKLSLDRAIEASQRSDTMVYCIYFEGDEGGGGRMGPVWGGGRRGGGGWPFPQGGGSSSDGKRILERLSRETGGRMFVVSRSEPIDQIYRQIQDELRNQYSLGYSPDRPAEAGSEYRHIRVSTRRSDLKVQYRDGYYASRQVTAATR